MLCLNFHIISRLDFSRANLSMISPNARDHEIIDVRCLETQVNSVSVESL